MNEFSFVHKTSSMLSPGEQGQAADLLSYAYTRWQNDPRNTNPLKTDTSPEVYSRMLQLPGKEALLYFEEDRLVAVFVHALSPHAEQSTLRKLSFVGARPLERGFAPLKTMMQRYAAHMASCGEDVAITTDLDQATLNSLLEVAGFREIHDRNETYFVLSRLLDRKLITWRSVQDDFVIDEIITLDGKALRRDKKLYMLQTTSCDPYQLFRRELSKRLERCLPQENRSRLQEALSHADDGLYFLLGYYDSIIQRSPDNASADTGSRIFGPWADRDMARYCDPEEGLVYLLPENEDAIRDIAGEALFRPGVFDFMTMCLKMLASVVMITGAPLAEVETVLGRTLHPQVPLRLKDMVETVLAPDMKADPRFTRNGRTGYRLESPFARVAAHGLAIDKRAMVEHALTLRGASRAPIIYCGGHEEEFDGVARLFEEAETCSIPTLVLDFGHRLTQRILESCMGHDPERFPCFSILPVQDYYQLPVILELLGLPLLGGMDMELQLAP